MFEEPPSPRFQCKPKLEGHCLDTEKPEMFLGSSKLPSILSTWDQAESPLFCSSADLTYLLSPVSAKPVLRGFRRRKTASQIEGLRTTWKGQ